MSSDSSRPRQAAAPSDGAGEGPSTPPRVLVVEDEFVIAMVIETVLEDIGFVPVGIAADQAEALALAEAEKPDFVTLDLSLRGGERGEDVGRALQERFGLPALVISAYLGETNPDFPHITVLGQVSKPFDETKLGKALRAAAERLRKPN